MSDLIERLRAGADYLGKNPRTPLASVAFDIHQAIAALALLSETAPDGEAKPYDPTTQPYDDPFHHVDASPHATIEYFRNASAMETAVEMDRRGDVIERLEEDRDALGDKLNAIRKVRDGYANRARFADIDCAVEYREFVRRLDEALVKVREEQ